MMLKNSVRALCLVALFSFAQPAFCQTWQELIAQAESLAGSGNVDSAQIVFQQALTAAETQYGPADTTQEIVCYPHGVPERVYFRSYTQAQEIYEAFLSLAERIYGDSSHVVLRLLFRLGVAYNVERRFEAAEAVVERALSIAHARFGENSLETAEAMLLKGIVNGDASRNKGPGTLFKGALTVIERSGGSDHPLASQCILAIANQWRCQDRCADADSAFEVALRIAQNAYLSDSLELARFHEVGGLIKYCRGDAEKGADQIRFAMNMWKKTYGSESVRAALTLIRLGNELTNAGEYQQAESLLVKSHDIRRRLFGSQNVQTALALGSLAYFNWRIDNFGVAESLFTEVVAVLEPEVGKAHPDYYYYIDWLASCDYDQGKYHEALALHEKCLEVSRMVYGEKSPEAYDDLWDISRTLMRMGQFADAESSLKVTLAGLREIHGPEDSRVGSAMTTLGLCLDGQGRFEEAESTYRQALDIKRKSLGPDHPEVAYTTHDLGLVYWSLGDYEQAEAHVSEAIRMWKKTDGLHDYGIACGYLNLGLIYESMGRYGEADSVLRLAIDLGEVALGPKHPALAHACNNLANVCMKQGQYEEAESSQLRAVSILEGALGPEHPEVAKFRRDLGRIYAYAGKPSESLEAYDVFIDWSQRFLENVFPYSSEGQKLNWMREYPLMDHTVFSVALDGSDTRSRGVALEMLMKSKAMVVEAVMSERKAAYCMADDAIIAQLEKLNNVHTLIASLALAGGSFADSLKVLYDIKDSLEIALSRHCSEFGDALAARRFEVADVASTIPDESVVWEFARYEPVDLSPDVLGDDKLGPERYLGFVLSLDGAVAIRDLGDAARIDSLIASARDLIYKAQGQIYSVAAVTAEKRLKDVTGQLYDLVFGPLAAVSEGKSNICISPDGMLNLLPFEILPTPDGSYAIENYRISYLSSGRDLLKYKNAETSEGDMIIMADPDFDGSNLSQTGEKSPTVATVSSEMYGPDMRGIVDCLKSDFNRLGHTRYEAESVAKQVKATNRMAVREFYDKAAAEGTLKNLSDPPRVLHLATHGFFCETGEAEATIKDNPLLRSGLVLTGANKTIAGERDDSTSTEDGILTALEVSGLNLVGTDLAVLSACETGVGDFVNGEGLFGLRRAFQHAGVETIVMSLWSVPDKETSQLMDGFYRRWLAGSTKRDALRESALEVLNNSRDKRGCGHPLLWGGFILAGNPN